MRVSDIYQPGDNQVPPSVFVVFKKAGLTSFTFNDPGDEEYDNDSIMRRKINLKTMYEKIDDAIEYIGNHLGKYYEIAPPLFNGDALRRSCKRIVAEIHSADEETRFIPDKFTCQKCLSWLDDPVLVPEPHRFTRLDNPTMCCRKCIVHTIPHGPDRSDEITATDGKEFWSNTILAEKQAEYRKTRLCVTGTSTYNIVLNPLDLGLYSIPHPLD